ncbi:hypothetical protein AS850_06255 [Frondihabitans sp. 762G35]|uniref:hypothetical protein n=1 Tax=Frondihabitans sp. 762G35 TaxID=1446794 RepID=UPI000D1FF529|nr:hypothetical protein [Frondihabitans sp. 762G35]ARC56675.1 hypothetical protein AS850_06255 [Frondihabitans sp. 762G35]
MTESTLPADDLCQRVASAVAPAYRDESHRERVISLLTTALVMVAGAGTFAFGQMLVTLG